VEGRGKQRGKEEVAKALNDINISRSLGFVPKIMLSIVIDDPDVDKVVNKMLSINHTGRSGDGKIFVCPIEESIRIRTGEHGTEALT